jgi:hypothetical protein
MSMCVWNIEVFQNVENTLRLVGDNCIRVARNFGANWAYPRARSAFDIVEMWLNHLYIEKHNRQRATQPAYITAKV